ncbi:hypothetical protein PoB_002529000 [Plakobranchus ocellatus]|uniref:Uncharacterized protein n=1 Tax=Plakobranchus ocellatus TaxID=259542 RepID=A0AAV3ZVX7_9GAST|nr:hypothetical protein PoB_002529000 [Plakobranchus ocellatus]
MSVLLYSVMSVHLLLYDECLFLKQSPIGEVITMVLIRTAGRVFCPTVILKPSPVVLGIRILRLFAIAFLAAFTFARRPSYPLSAGWTQGSNEKLTWPGLGFELLTSYLLADCPTR